MSEETSGTKVQQELERWTSTTRARAVEEVAERMGGRFPLAGAETVQPLYVPRVEEEGYLTQLGFPGEYPFTRGVQPTMYRGRHWTMRQYAGFGDATETNRRYRFLMQKGTKALSVAFDLPTQMGYDSDHPLALGEVGKVGVAIDTVEDLKVLFAGIPLDQVSTSMTINSTAGILLAMYLAVAQEQGVPAAKLRGTLQNDVLKEYMARGTYIYPPRPALRLITDVLAFCAEQVPAFNPISISGYHIREAGSDAIQEVAFCLADGLAYVEAAVQAGLNVDKFGRRLSFFFNSHNNFLEEIAKFRAARRLWARLLRERFGAGDEACKLRFHTQTAGCTLTAQQPTNNVVRVALQALAAVLGGTQSLHTNSLDEALALPAEESVKLALRTQQVIAHESGVADFVDPLAGSYAVEALTDGIERGARAYIERIDALGGMVAAIEQGFPQREIESSAYRYQLEVERQERIVVGVNQYQEAPGARPGNLLRLDPAIESRQTAGLAAVKASRDAGRVAAALATLQEVARGTGNLMPPILEAVTLRASVGEISDALREVFGVYRPAR
ncbi:MAG: methylmalonyl-CoA mutase family protein [Myxococcota bacterium]|nr:methylmalonyl-CoA mutase family protein [Myxococcota bacterium]